MNKKRHQFKPADSFGDQRLESRLVLSASTVGQTAAEVAGRAAHGAATKSTLTIIGGTLGQPTTFVVTVRGNAARGAPSGTVNLVDHGRVIQTLTLSPTTSTDPRFATASASYTMTPVPGGSAYFFGRHAISARFVSDGTLSPSAASKTFVVAQPAYTTIAGGVKVATIADGTGPAIQAGQTANVLYTGYLSKNGAIFDDSISHGGTPMGFTVGVGQMIPGFDAGTSGMKVGETRIIRIPPAEGYGAVANGPIPANSTLIFVVTLQSIA